MPTKIEWVRNPDGSQGEVWNPVTGCSPVSAGCVNCYARRMSKRLQAMGQPKYVKGFKVRVHDYTLEDPLKWKKPRAIFVNSMSDLFHEEVPEEFIKKAFDIMKRAHWHRFQILTKRLARLAELAPRLDWPSNVWMGVSVEHPNHLWRIDDLLDIPAAKHFVSFEPLLGAVDIFYPKVLYPDGPVCCRCTGRDGAAGGQPIDPPLWWRSEERKISWVICGAETGPGARPMDLDWARSLRDQCLAAGIPFFFKRDSEGSRFLDGRMWEEMP